MTDTLKRCPCCGNEAIIMDHSENSDSDRFAHNWSICCCHCGGSPIEDHVDYDTAIKIWNTRPIENELIRVLRDCYLEYLDQYHGDPAAEPIMQEIDKVIEKANTRTSELPQENNHG